MVLYILRSISSERVARQLLESWRNHLDDKQDDFEEKESSKKSVVEQIDRFVS